MSNSKFFGYVVLVCLEIGQLFYFVGNYGWGCWGVMCLFAVASGLTKGMTGIKV